MTKIEITLNLIAQEVPQPLGYFLGMFLFSGMFLGIAAAIIVGGLWSRDKKRIEKEAAAAGVTLNIESSSGVDVQEIEACGYCIGFIIIIVAAVMGVSLPTILPEAAEDILMATLVIIFGALFWALALWSVPYVRSYRLGFRKKLQQAIETQHE